MITQGPSPHLVLEGEDTVGASLGDAGVGHPGERHSGVKSEAWSGSGEDKKSGGDKTLHHSWFLISGAVTVSRCWQTDVTPRIIPVFISAHAEFPGLQVSPTAPIFSAHHFMIASVETGRLKQWECIRRAMAGISHERTVWASRATDRLLALPLVNVHFGF